VDAYLVAGFCQFSDQFPLGCRKRTGDEECGGRTVSFVDRQQLSQAFGGDFDLFRHRERSSAAETPVELLDVICEK